MADYSDKTLRALIRHLITEDVPTDAIGPRAQTSSQRKALGTFMAAAAVRKLFSLKGIVGLTAMGLIFEPAFTKDLLNFGLDQFKDLTKAIEVFNETEGSIFEKLAAASDHMKDSTRKNKYLYLHDLKKHVSEGGSLPGNFVYSAMTSYNNYKPTARQIADGEITPGDVEIYNAIATNDFSSVYDSTQFERGKNGIPVSIVNFDHTRPYKKPSTINLQPPTIGNEYNDLIKDAEKNKKYLNANIIEAIRDAHEHTTLGEKDSAIEAYGKAGTIYRIAEASPSDEIDKITMFENIEDIEKNFGNGFISAIQNRVSAKAEEAFTNLVNTATDIVRNNLKKPFQKKEK